jgi:hypothetical protein
VDECSSSGQCDEEIDREKVLALHERLAHDLAKQYGEQVEAPNSGMVRQEVNFDGPTGSVQVTEPELYKEKKKKRKGRKKSGKKSSDS